MRPPHRRPHRFPVHPRIDTRVTSPTILGVLAVSLEPSVKMRTLYVLHAHAACLPPCSDPAAASAAWRPSPHTAVEPQPHPGALTGAGPGAAGRAAVETPYAAAAALSHAPGIGAGNHRRLPCRAMAAIEARCVQRHQAKRPRRMGLCSEVADDGENLEDHPVLATRYVRRKAPFQHANCPASWPRAALNLFHSVQTKSCLGHCITRGIGLRRQATILRLRGAVLFSMSASEAGAGIRTRPRG